MENGFFDIQELGTMPTQSMENKGTLVARANDQKFAMSISHWLASRENLDTCEKLQCLLVHMHAFCTLAKKQQEKKEIIPWNDDKMRFFYLL
jgi:hypothetical protein